MHEQFTKKNKITIIGEKILSFIKEVQVWEFPGGLMVRIPCFHCHGVGSVPGGETEIPQAAW